MCTHFIGTQQAITYQREQEAQITYQATHDLLTGLPNEVLFQETVHEALIVDGGRGALAVLYLDLDGFKPINDELGHHVGNQVLITIARRLADLSAPEATVARLVGDEFALLLPGYTNRKEVIQLAERSLHSVNLRHGLHTALNENQFEIHYQPLVDAVTGRMRSVEALVRWHHPTRGMISPGEFIPLAEQTGQIVPLGLWVGKQACIEIADFNAQRERGHVLPSTFHRCSSSVAAFWTTSAGYWQKLVFRHNCWNWR